MAKIPESKRKTLAAAAQLFRERGYHGTALHDVLAAGGAPRGSLYFHFPQGKEQIGEAALTLAAEAVRAAIAGAAATSVDAETFVVRIARGMGGDLAQSDFRNGCPIATTALETSSESRILAAVARAAFQGWEREIASGLVHFGYEPDAAARIATTVLCLYEGALLLARTYRDLGPMQHAEDAAKLLLQAKQSA